MVFISESVGMRHEARQEYVLTMVEDEVKTPTGCGMLLGLPVQATERSRCALKQRQKDKIHSTDSTYPHIQGVRSLCYPVG